MSQSLNRAYISDIDIKLAELDQTAAVQHNPQHKEEVKKAKRIAEQRDNENSNHDNGALWEDF